MIASRLLPFLAAVVANPARSECPAKVVRIEPGLFGGALDDTRDGAVADGPAEPTYGAGRVSGPFVSKSSTTSVSTATIDAAASRAARPSGVVDFAPPGCRSGSCFVKEVLVDLL